MKNKLESFFNPKNIAIVGASDKEGSVGGAITKNILDLGYQGEVFLINPKYSELLGRKCYRDLNSIEEEIDLAIIVIPAVFVNETVEASNNVKNFIVISAGFSEIGKEGWDREWKLLEIANQKGINILGPNCLGMISPKINLNASFASGMPERGKVSLISQSGALVVAMLDMAKSRQISFSQILSVGNKMQLSELELMEYLAEDEDTDVIALYLEGIKDGAKFIQVAQKVSQKKSVIVLKAGRSEKSQKAIASHTGSLAGSDDVIDVVFSKSGVIRAESLEDFFILITLISNFKKFSDLDCAIITNAGGPGVLATDAFRNKNIKLKDFSMWTKEELKKNLPAESSVENPVDLLGDADEVRYQKTLEIMENEEVGNILCLMTAQDQTPTEKIAKVLVEFSNKSQKNIIPIIIGGERIEKALDILKENKIPNFEFPKEVIDALDRIISRRQIVASDRSRLEIEKKIFLEKSAKLKSEDIIKEAVEKNKKALLFGEAGELMKQYNIPVVDFINLNPKDDLSENIDFPVVLKLDSEKVLHKTEKKGLVLNIKNGDELKKEVGEMRTNFPGENLIIQPMLEYEAELIVGLKRDSVFGPVIIFGLGGIYTEIFKMIDFLILPASKEEIKKSIEQSKVSFLFKETRGKMVGDINEFAELLFNFASLVEVNEEIKEVDINPLLITRDGKLKAVDVKIIL